jgi:hypothetical protein
MESSEQELNRKQTRWSEPPTTDSGEDELRRAREEIEERLRHRGITLTGDETGAELLDLLDAVERFEIAVEGSGGDLLVDEPIGSDPPIQPDDEAFVLPRRSADESIATFLRRIADATTRASRGQREDDG